MVNNTMTQRVYCPRCQAIHGKVCPNKPKRFVNNRALSSSKRSSRPWSRKRKAIFERDNYLCQEHLRYNKIVRVDLHGEHAGICDHIIPESEGGTDDDDNLQTLCKACNKIKTAKEGARAAQAGYFDEHSSG